MGPKKEPRKKETDTRLYSIDDPINSNDWNCVVAMAVEKTSSDSFVLKAFLEEAVNGRRQQVKLINYDTFVMKILDDFANGELPYKYAFLLNFSSVFQEAAACISNKVEIPVALLAKVVKALLFHLKEESLVRAEKKISGPVDPVKAMAERPANVGGALGGKSKSKKDLVTTDKKKKQTGNDKLTIRPPSMSKQDTKLLKRGEGIKEDQCIDDAPDGGFHLYVLLTGFYHPEFPLELIKAEVPLYILLCVDTSLSEVRPIEPPQHTRTQKRNSENRTEEIESFWETFLKILWSPEVSSYYNNTIFQVYVPKKLTCEDVKEFIYREICYLLYDISDLSRQLGNYLQHMKLWDVGGEPKPELYERYNTRMAGVDVECATVSVILRQITETVSEEDVVFSASASVDSRSDVMYSTPSRFHISQSVVAKRGSWPVEPIWSQLLSITENAELSSVYVKTKELDLEYSLDEECRFGSSKTNLTKRDSLGFCQDGSDSVFASYWKSIQKCPSSIFVDYSLYLLLLTRVVCFYDYILSSGSWSIKSPSSSRRSFKQILDDEMRKPHFTVTHGSRSILSGTPYNIKEASRDFFSPPHFKLVTPEKLKASSAPEFRSVQKPSIERSFISELTYPLEYLKNNKLTVFENLRRFLGEQMFDQVIGFDFLEEVDKTKLLAKENEYMGKYNCIDSSYSVVADALFVVFHNRKGSDNTHHETFNGVLKTAIGLRDFYDYTLEDEADWLKRQEELPRGRSLTLTNSISQEGVSNNYTDSHFWLEKSIKYQEYLKLGSRNIKDSQRESKEEETEVVDLNKPPSTTSVPGEIGESYAFHGYDISKAAVQFSGLKTVYYADDCSITVELLERLYGDQHLGVHAFLNGHTLHLYSYVCPQPHLHQMYTFHITLRSGVVVAFTKRLIDVLEEIEVIDSNTTLKKDKKSTSAVSATETVKTVLTTKTIEDEEFAYDLTLSLPNGLTLSTVRSIVKPCYIKQQYSEATRLFLPNGNVVEITNDQTQILKADATVVVSSNPTQSNIDTLESYHITTPEGVESNIENGRITSKRNLTLFRNSDLESSTTYYRRGDGASYMFLKNGTMCVEFKDGTRISSTPFIEDWEEDSYSDSTAEDEASFVFVQLEVTMEHPDYATVIYNTQTQAWKVLLPFGTSIGVHQYGSYLVQIDDRTDLQVDPKLIVMKRFHPERGITSVTADLSVFDDTVGRIYCRMTDSFGKTFAVEPNSNCYVLNEELGEGQFQDEKTLESFSNETEPKLSRDNKYFVVRRDITGYELLHTEDVRKLIDNPTPGMVVYVPEVLDSDIRIFVLISPASQKRRKWEVESVLPNPKFVPGIVKTETTTTYGVPPSWMHPFPKRKKKLEIPSQLTCRVFIEINRTDLEPQNRPPDCLYCQVEDTIENEFATVDPNKIQEYITRLTNDDQDMLREMYIAAIQEAMIKANPKSQPEGSEALKQYLAQSERLVSLQKYHQKCIRYHMVPNYFEHPIGMSWLILNGIIDRLTCPEDQKRKPARSRLPSPRSFKSQSTFSNEEIEYDLSISSEQSYSDLTCRTDLSLKSAPTVLMSGNVCTCKIRPTGASESAPLYTWKDGTSSESRVDMPREGICTIRADALKELDKPAGGESVAMTLSNLMSLGLI